MVEPGTVGDPPPMLTFISDCGTNPQAQAGPSGAVVQNYSQDPAYTTPWDDFIVGHSNHQAQILDGVLLSYDIVSRARS